MFYRALMISTAILAGGSAHAQDWSGYYGGVGLSMPTGEAFFSEVTGTFTSNPGDFDGVTPALVFGYAQQAGSIVYGANVSIDFGSFDAEGTSSGFFCIGNSCNVQVETPIAVTARVGYAAGSFLPYVAAGIAGARGTGTFDGGAIDGGSDYLLGWTAGLGAEYAVSDGTSVFAEYMHTDLGRLELPNNCGVQCFTDVAFGQARIGVNFRF